MKQFNTIIRYGIYSALIFAYMLLLPKIVGRWGAAPFYEDAPVEWCQFACLILTTLIFMYGAWRERESRALFAIMALLVAFAATREMDHLLDHNLPLVGWKIGYILLLAAAWLCFSHFTTLITQGCAFSRSPAFVLLWAGFIIAIPLAQLLGHRPLFKIFVASEQIRPFKRIIEESVELVGYMVLLFGSLEALLQSRAGSRVSR